MIDYNLLTISKKQKPIVEKLDQLLDDALAVAAAIRDNAQDNMEPMPSDLVTSFISSYHQIVYILRESTSPDLIDTLNTSLAK